MEDITAKDVMLSDWLIGTKSTDFPEIGKYDVESESPFQCATLDVNVYSSIQDTDGHMRFDLKPIPLEKKHFLLNGFEPRLVSEPGRDDRYVYEYDMFDHADDYTDEEYDEDAWVRIDYSDDYDVPDEYKDADEIPEEELITYTEFYLEPNHHPFKYVHELQDFLRSIGFKKLADNFKI